MGLLVWGWGKGRDALGVRWEAGGQVVTLLGYLAYKKLLAP